MTGCEILGVLTLLAVVVTVVTSVVLLVDGIAVAIENKRAKQSTKQRRAK